MRFSRQNRIGSLPRRHRAGGVTLLRGENYRRPVLYNTALHDPRGANLYLDRRYVAPTQQDIACFLQDGGTPLEFIRPVTPPADSTAAVRSETLSTHLIGDYGDNSTVKLFQNGVELPVTVAASVDGVIVTRAGGAFDFVEDPAYDDNRVTIRAEGTEAVAGALSTIYLIYLPAKRATVVLATAVVPVRALLVKPAAAAVTLRQAMRSFAAAAVLHRAVDIVRGFGAARIFVGDFVWQFDSGVSINVAEVSRGIDGDFSLEIEGYVVNPDGSFTFEISGPSLNTDASFTIDISTKTLTFDSGVSINIGLLDQKALASFATEIWGKQTGDPSGTLVIRTSSLPAAVKAALEAHGIKFNA